MKRFLFLFLLAAVVSGCVASPVSVNLANDVEGNVSQEIGTIETTSDNVIAPAPTREAGDWLVLLAGFALPVLFVIYVVTKLTKFSSATPVSKEEAAWRKWEKDQYE